MRAVGGGEGVVDIDVAELGELVDMGRIVLLLALVKAGVLEQKHVAVLHFGDRVVGRLADAVGREGDRPLDDLGDRGGDGLERIGLIRAALGPAEMGEKNDLAALVRDLRDGRRNALDARRIGHPAVLRRNVEIDAQEHAFARDIGVIERAERFAHVAPLKLRAGGDAFRLRPVLSCPRSGHPVQPLRSSGAFATRLIVNAAQFGFPLRNLSAESVNPAITSFDELDAQAPVIRVSVVIRWHGWSTEVVEWHKELHRGAILGD